MSGEWQHPSAFCKFGPIGHGLLAPRKIRNTASR